MEISSKATDEKLILMGYDLGMMIEEFADAFIHAQGLEKEMSELKQKIGEAYSGHDEIFETGSDTELVKDIERYLHLTDTLLEARLVLDRHEKVLGPVINLLHNKTLTHQVNNNSGNGKTSFDVTVQDNGRLAVTNIRKT